MIGRNYVFEFTDKDSNIIGYDVDIIKAIAEVEGFEVEIVNLPFDSLVPSVLTSQIDGVIAAMTITPDRAKQVAFSDPYYKSGISAVIRKDDIEKYAKNAYKKSDKGFINSYRYQKSETDGEILVVFVDCTRDLQMFKDFVVTGIFVCVLGLFLVFWAVFFLSKLAASASGTGKTVAPGQRIPCKASPVNIQGIPSLVFSTIYFCNLLKRTG